MYLKLSFIYHGSELGSTSFSVQFYLRDPRYCLYAIGKATFLTYISTDDFFSDRKHVPTNFSGNSDGIGIFSEFRSESATKGRDYRHANPRKNGPS